MIEKIKTDFTLSEIANTVKLMRKRFETGQRLDDPVCRLQLGMSEYLVAELESAREEICYLRNYGNKECTNMADDARVKKEQGK